MNFDLENVSCNLCKQSSARLYSSVSYMDYLNRRPEVKRDNARIPKNDKLARHKFNLVKCNNCGLIYVNPRPTSLSELYGDDYFSHYIDTESEAHRKRKGAFKAEVAELEELVKKLKVGRKILDVGCGGGFFLDSLNNSWEKYGNEINPVAAEYARDAFRINISKGALRQVNFPDETFGVVKIRNVIEHLTDPMSELCEIHRILRKGGLIAVSTLDIGSLCGRIYKEKFRMVCPPEHLYYFSTKTISLMLKEARFKTCKVSYHYFNTPYFSWKHPLRILWDIISFRVYKPNTVSPPFYGNMLDIYATKV